MALGVRYALLAPAAIRKSVHDVAQIPFVVTLVLEQLDPHVGHGHGEAVVEADAALRNWDAEERHARHVFSNGDDGGIKSVQKVIGLIAVR